MLFVLFLFTRAQELDQQDKAKQDAFFEPFRKSIKDMIDLLNASSHLDCKPLFNLVCATACATYLRGALCACISDCVCRSDP